MNSVLKTRKFAPRIALSASAFILVAVLTGCAKGSLPLPRQPSMPSGLPLPSSGGGGLPSPTSMPAPGGSPSSGLPSGGVGSPSAGAPSMPSGGAAEKPSDGAAKSNESQGDGGEGGGGGGSGPDGVQDQAGEGGDGNGPDGSHDQAGGGDGPDGAQDQAEEGGGGVGSTPDEKASGWEVSTELPDVTGAGQGADVTGNASAPGASTVDDKLSKALADLDKDVLDERLANDRRAAESRRTNVDVAEQSVPAPPPVTPRAPAPPVPDTPDARDDDVVARQLREAAEKETDPKLREALWEEYERYRNGL